MKFIERELLGNEKRIADAERELSSLRRKRKMLLSMFAECNGLKVIPRPETVLAGIRLKEEKNAG